MTVFGPDIQAIGLAVQLWSNPALASPLTLAPVPPGDHAVVVQTEAGTLTIDEAGRVSSGDPRIIERFIVANHVDCQLVGKAALSIARMALAGLRLATN